VNIAEDAQRFLEKKDAAQQDSGYDGSGCSVGVESSECVAKCSVIKTGVAKYFIRVCRRGIDTGTFYNPQVHSKAELVRYDAHTGKMRYHFTEVSQSAFDNYVGFLKTGNVALLRVAQRS
jgi:hypothetical protein